MADLEVFQKAKTFADYGRQQRADDLQMVDAYARARSTSMGANLPATIRVAREIQSAIARGDTQYAQLLIDSGKLDPKGTIREFGLDDGMQQPMMQPTLPTPPTNKPKTTGILADSIAGNIEQFGKLPTMPEYNDVAPRIEIPAPISSTPTGALRPRPGSDIVYKTEAGAKELGKLEQQLNMEPAIAGAKKDAENKANAQADTAKKAKNASNMSPILLSAEALLKNAPAGLFDRAYMGAAAAAGKDTELAETQSSLEVLAANLLQNVPRMEGPQSDADRIAYERAAGDIANINKPRSARIAAVNEIKRINERYTGKMQNTAPQGGGFSIRRLD
jgi:hypothetical protein